MVEIRWHGRGGQGAKTASLLLAEAAFNTGRYIQGFPQYGPERMGSPITAYNRISDSRISIHSEIDYPDYVVVIDDSLLNSIEVTDGLKSSGSLVLNLSAEKQQAFREGRDIPVFIEGFTGKIFALDARAISMDAVGRYFPNIPMLGALIGVSRLIERDAFLGEMQSLFQKKFSKKPELVEGNMKALRRSIDEVAQLVLPRNADVPPNQAKPAKVNQAKANPAHDGAEAEAGSVTGEENEDWRQMSPGGTIRSPGNSAEYKTGDWRSMKPVWIVENCTQCLLCCPVCPDVAIPVDETGNRTEFDYEHCKGCGICFKVCPFNAIDFIEEGK